MKRSLQAASISQVGGLGHQVLAQAQGPIASARGRSWRWVFVVAVAGLLAGGCGASATTGASTVPSGKTAPQDAYVASASRLNRDMGAFFVEAGQWTPQTSHDQTTAAAAPVMSDVANLQHTLSVYAGRWPARARASATDLQNALPPLAADLGALGTLDLTAASAWQSKFQNDAAGVGRALAAMSHQLGVHLSA